MVEKKGEKDTERKRSNRGYSNKVKKKKQVVQCQKAEASKKSDRDLAHLRHKENAKPKSPVGKRGNKTAVGTFRHFSK